MFPHLLALFSTSQHFRYLKHGARYLKHGATTTCAKWKNDPKANKTPTVQFLLSK